MRPCHTFYSFTHLLKLYRSPLAWYQESILNRYTLLCKLYRTPEHTPVQQQRGKGKLEHHEVYPCGDSITKLCSLGASCPGPGTAQDCSDVLPAHQTEPLSCAAWECCLQRHGTGKPHLIWQGKSLPAHVKYVKLEHSARGDDSDVMLRCYDLK